MGDSVRMDSIHFGQNARFNFLTAHGYHWHAQVIFLRSMRTDFFFACGAGANVLDGEVRETLRFKLKLSLDQKERNEEDK